MNEALKKAFPELSDNDRWAVQAFAMTMKALGQNTDRSEWSVKQNEEDPNDGYEIGYTFRRMPLDDGEWNVVFLAIPILPNAVKVRGKKKAAILNVENKWELFNLVHHPGSFNPYDGGTPPETSEHKLGEYAMLSALFRRVIAVWVDGIFDTALENAMMDDAPKEDDRGRMTEEV